MRDVVGRDRPLDLLLVGTSHRVADVERRERLAQSLGDVPAWLDRARAAAPAIAELLVIATCHRLEIYAITSAATEAEAQLSVLTTSSSSNDAEGPGRGRYVKVGEAAAEHLARVACGLDSLILGEAEIAGQVRRAAAVCRDRGAVGPHLERIVAGALRASGRARSETAIGRGVMSAASAAVALVAASVGSLRGRTVLVAGAGHVGRQTLGRLARLGPSRLLVASRSAHHALDAAAATGAEVVALDAVSTVLPDVDVLVAALASPTRLIEASDVEAHGPRASRPLTVVDLSMPRVVDPRVGGVAGVTLWSVDDLGEIARQSATRRAREVPAVEAIARDEAHRAYANLRARAGRRSQAR